MADLATPGIDVGTALRALPLEAPDTSAWPALARRIAPPRPRTRRAFALALVASVLLAALLVRVDRGTTSPSLPDVVAHADDVPALMDESARLERLLAATRDDVAANASAMVLSLQLEDRLQSLDAALAQPDVTDARRLALWRERVDLLHAAAGLESSRRYYAAQGRALEPTLVATY
jgi:hypothetical protein